MKHRILALLLALGLLVILALPGFAAFDPETRNSVAVVYICVDDVYGNSYGLSWGTGFFVGPAGEDPNYLVTNHHVVEDFLDLGGGELTELSMNGQPFNGRAKIRIHYDATDYDDGYLVGYDSIKDLAVIKLEKPTSKRSSIPIMAPRDDMVGSTVYALGYPGLAENVWANATTSWGIKDCTVTKGTVSRLFMTAGTGTNTIQIDLDIKHGNSGGPLVTEDKVVIGVNTWGYIEDSEEINYAVSAAEVISLLRRYNVPYTDGSVVPEPETGLPTWAIVLIAAAALALVALAIVLIRRGKKGKRPSVKGGMPGVRSLSTQHRGTVLQVTAQPMLLGRGPDCAVIYQNGTPGVSSRHCSLSYDEQNGCFLLTDLQSTYGTYLQNGQRLAPNVAYRLQPGDRCYLGEPQNTLLLSRE